MQIVFNILISLGIFFTLSISFLFTYYPTRFFHIAHAVVITLGAYFTYLFFIQLQLSLFIAIPLAIIFSTLIGVLCELIVYKPMREKNLPPLAYLIASIGLYVVLQNIISLVSGDDTKTLRTGEVRVGNEFLGAYITDIQIIIIAVSLVLFILVLLFNKYSKTGKAIRAVSANPELSNIFGINSNKIILISFAIGSALGSVAGILSAFDTNMTPTMGFNLLLYGVVAMIIGGVGSYKGLIGGALLVASAQHLAAYYIDTKWMDAVAYIILILFLIWKPLGFSGQRLKKVEI